MRSPGFHELGAVGELELLDDRRSVARRFK